LRSLQLLGYGIPWYSYVAYISGIWLAAAFGLRI